MKIHFVTTPAAARAFINVPKVLYRSDPNYISPLDTDIEGIFNPDTNPYFSHGVCARWVLTGPGNKLTGRIAAFINHNKSNYQGQVIGGIGFFDCIDSQEAAALLFETAEVWLKEQGVTEVHAPINFGENDRFWGLLIEGFSPASFGMNYNYPYYQKLFEGQGYTIKYEQITNVLDISKPFPERFTAIANRVARNGQYHFRHYNPQTENEVINAVTEIYNDGWSDFENFHPMEKEVLRSSLQAMKPIMDPKLVILMYHNQEPVSFIVLIPDANNFIWNINGKLNLAGKIKFLINKLKGASRIRAIVMGTKKAYRNKGLESALFLKIGEHVLPKKHYKQLELSWVGDFNTRMLSLHKATGSQPHKKHATLYKHI